MSDFESLNSLIKTDPLVWQGHTLDEETKESVIERLFAGEIAIERKGEVSNSTANMHFALEEINGKSYLVPARYRAMLNFFLNSACRPAASAHSTVSAGHNSLITGGPGTGKSYQIARFIETLAAAKTLMPTRVAIAAPTGKAAARFAGLESSANLLVECLTIHRLLQLSPDGGRAKYHAANPLPVDVLIVDEISMVDLGLFVRLIAALPLHAQVVLAGDTGQLPAVDGIAIAPALEFLKAAGLIVHVELTETQRFSAAKAAVYSSIQQKGIAALAGDAEGMRIIDFQGTRSLYRYFDSYARDSFCNETLLRLTSRLSATEVNTPIWMQTAREIYTQLQRSIVLCESNEGNHGTVALNNYIAKLVADLNARQALKVTPVMITANSYELQLFNGDTGFIVSDGRQDFAVIETKSELKQIPLGRLRYWQVAYAITVHKSQGSEYPEVHIIHESRPAHERDHRLLYTAVTRAREQAIILNIK